jgi:hypothetical protein
MRRIERHSQQTSWFRAQGRGRHEGFDSHCLFRVLQEGLTTYLHLRS